MNFFKKLIFILSLSALQQSVKVEAQTTECGGTYSGLSGTISSPNYPSNYNNNLNCYYYIQISPPNYVNITFTSFETQLTFDWLQVNCSSDSTIVTQRFSGSGLASPVLIPPCSNVSLHFHTDNSIVFQGFRLIYSIYNECGGTFWNLSGTISSPNYPLDYYSNLNCSYYIQIFPPNSVGITFTSFATESCCDWLEVRCSSDSSIFPPQRFSGSVLPSYVSIPSCSSVLLLFHTDGSVVRQGFRLRYIVGGGCSGTYSNISGTISSPNYPSNYGNNLNCSYNIQIPPSNSVNITFISFATESNYDWLQVSCPGNSAILAQKFDGNHLPPFLSIRSCSRVQLLFRTDGSTVAQGFSLRYNIGNGLQGGLTMKPSNLSVRSDATEPIVLSCSSRAIQPNVYPWWSFSTDGIVFRIITAPDCSLFSSLPNSSPLYFSTARQDSTGTCNLTISPSYVTSAVGYYTCTDATLDYASARVTSYIVCGGTFTNVSGTISSPNYPFEYNNNLNCSYYIQMSPPNSVVIAFISFATEPSYDWLEVSCSSDSTRLAQRFSGSDLPSPLSIPLCSNVLLLFHTDGSAVRQGFSLRYIVGGGGGGDGAGDACGRTFSNLSGTISSPNYPSNYDNNLNCSYYIQISPPNSVGITFISFATESIHDWLEVSCSNDASIPAQRFFGSDMPSLLSIPPCSRVLLLFHTDGSVVRQGFSLRYRVGVSYGCDGTYSNLSGTISSPNYPSNYGNNLNCSYNIQISPPNSVNITFISFATESNFDWLQVICPGNNAIPAQKFDGNHLPPFLSIHSCSRVQLLFHTDSSTVAQGFSLRYDIGNGLQGGLTMRPSNVSVRNATIEPIVLSCSSRAIQPDVYPWWSYSTDGIVFRIITAPNCSLFSSLPNSSPLYFSTSRQDSTGTCNLTISPSYVTSAVGYYTCTDATLDYASARVTSNIACGGTFTNLSGTISSPNYPSDYSNNLNCSYYIQTSPTNPVGIMFISFATESTHDWLEISCSNDSSIPAQRFSGSDMPSPLSIPLCSSVLLLFHTDGSVVRQGFSLRYRVGVSYGCGGAYSSLSGTISSPNYPSNYGNNLNCSYNIQIPPSNSVNITFISFATESTYDWLQVICPGNSAIPAQKFDGTHLPPFLSIRSCSRVQLLFRTDGSTVAQGFSLRYDIGNGMQGGLTTKPSNVSVQSDTTEPIVLSCSSRAIQPDVYPWWSFSTDGIVFRIITASDCSLFSSLPNSNRMYFSTARQDSTGTCNLTILPYYLTSAVGFYTCTDATLDYATARVTSYIACGGTYTNLSGIISSPNYPSNYGSNLNCSYYIQISPPNSVGIAFTSFITELTYDWLEVSCSSDSTILDPQRFSGSVLPSYLSIPPCSSVLLLFHTDGSVANQGFRLRYIVGGACDVTYSNISGTISSPNYPSNYDNNLNCSYYIQVPPSNSVNITFISFATESTYDSLQVSCAGNNAIPAQRFHGTDLPPFLSIRSCSRVQLLFRTDGSTVAQGFSLRYNIGNGMQGGLTMKPSNLYVRSDTTEPIVLSCSSRAIQPDILYPWWSFSTDGTLFRIITAPDCSVFSSLPVYYSTARQDSTGTCNLTISPSNVTSAVGYYTCTDATLDYASALVASPIVPSFTVEDLSYSGTDVVRGDQISITCSVRVLQTTSRSLQFTPSVYIYSDDNQRPIATSNSTANIIVLASPEVLPSYVCYINFTVPYRFFPSKYATNLPQNISMVNPSRPVLYWPEDKTMLIQGHDNGRVVANGDLRCFVPANPPATYQWTNEETNRLWKGPTVTVSNNGTYTCTANNVIRGVMYEVSKSINVTITPAMIDIQQTSPHTEKNPLNIAALIIGVVLGISVLLIVGAIVTYFYLRKKKKSAQNFNYYDMDAVIKSDGGHQNNTYDNMITLDGLPSVRDAVET